MPFSTIRCKNIKRVWKTSDKAKIYTMKTEQRKAPLKWLFLF